MNTQKPIEDCRQLCWMFLPLCFQKLFWYRGQNTISIGIGLPSTDPQQIPQLMETAKFAGWMRLGEGKGRVLEYTSYEAVCRRKQDDLSQEAEDALRRGVADLDEAFMVDMIRETLNQTPNAGSFVSAAISINDVLIDSFNRHARTAVVKNGKYLRLAENMPPMVENMESLEQIQRSIIHWARDCMKLLMDRRGEKEDAAILTARQYISAH